MNDHKFPPTEYDFEVLDPLPASLVKDVNNELSQLPAISDDDNVRVFLSKYDDSFRYQLNSAGKKKVPPAKPYVEFLILFDVMKKDTKAAKLESFQGYTKKMESELHELSSRSSEVQLYYVFKRMLDGNSKKILRDDAVRRVTEILKGEVICCYRNVFEISFFSPQIWRTQIVQR